MTPAEAEKPEHWCVGATAITLNADTAYGSPGAKNLKCFRAADRGAADFIYNTVLPKAITAPACNVKAIHVDIDVYHFLPYTASIWLENPLGTKVYLHRMNVVADLKTTYPFLRNSAESMQPFFTDTRAGTWTLNLLDTLSDTTKGTFNAWTLNLTCE